MRVGILTFHNIPNYGAALQALALCKRIKEKKVSCDIIDYQCKNVINREIEKHCARGITNNLINKLFIEPNRKKRIRGFEKFMMKEQVISSKIYLPDTLVNANKEYDMFITGSDQIWNQKITDKDLHYFLDFCDQDKYKAAFSSSVGKEWTKEEEINIIPLLQKFHSLSVREKNSAEYICQVTGKKCEWIEDPTFLLTPDTWSNYAEKPVEKDYVLVYYPNKKLMEYAMEYAKTKRKKLLVIQDGIKKREYKKINPEDPAKWLGYIKYASAVFTDSYHGLLFSLYFNKLVWTLNHSNRQQALAECLKINECFINQGEALQEIDYVMCNKMIDETRKKSNIYLDKILQECFEKGENLC